MSDYGSDGRSEWLDVDWSRHRRRLQVAGRQLELVEIGEGKPMLFIHGLGANWQTWLENLPHFARTHRCIAMDLPGFGQSEMPDGEISMSLYADVLDELCAALGVRAATVLGNSMGGFVAAELAIRHPERVERLVLVSPAILWQELRRAKPLMSLARLSELTVGRLLVGEAPRAVVSRPRLRHFAIAMGGVRAPHRLSREIQHELILTIKRTEGFLPALLAFGDYPVREELPRIAAPTLLIWGRDDTLVSVRDAHELADLIPQARVELFERTGHVAMLERPARFNAVVEQFVAGSARDRALAG
jgi:pimeloyl-ACP methyl ester carboxylesterase